MTAKFVKCNPRVVSNYLKPGVVYAVSSERTDRYGTYYNLKKFDREWSARYFTLVSCPCAINNCIKHRKQQP